MNVEDMIIIIEVWSGWYQSEACRNQKQVDETEAELEDIKKYLRESKND